jgi:hypothetical protein
LTAVHAVQHPKSEYHENHLI